jgi:hypothetical protein
MVSVCLAAVVAAAGCTRKQAKPGKGQAKKQEAAGATSTRELLKLIPADARTAVVVQDWPALYKLVGAVEGGLSGMELGRELLARARVLTGGLPITVPWNLAELRELGLDPEGPLAVYGKDQPLLLFSVKDEKLFWKEVAALAGRRGGKWTRQSAEGLDLRVLSGPLQAVCVPDGKRVLCSPNREAVLAAKKKKPARSLWGALSSLEQKVVSRATVVVAGTGHQVRGVGSLRVEGDGVTLRVRITGKPLQRLSTVLNTKGRPTLLSLAGDARTVIYGRLDLVSLMGMGKDLVPSLKKLGLDPIRLQARLTGEVLLMEGNDRSAALVVGSRDPSASREVVDVVARLLSAGASGKEKGQRGGLEVTPAGDGIYRIEAEAPIEGFPLKLSAGLAVGPVGIILGQWDAVKSLVRIQAPKAGGATLGKALTTPEEKEAFGKGAALAVRSYLGDPMGPFAPAVSKLLEGSGIPESARRGLNLGRYLLDLMHGVTLGLRQDSPEQVRLVLRLTTLHRDGQKDDDAARKLWLRGLESKYKGDDAAYSRVVETLAKKYAGTRYGGLKKRNQPTALGAAFAGLTAAVAIPAVVRYINRSQAVEAVQGLKRIAVGARIYYHNEHADKAGRLVSKRFPPTVGWTPAKSCCETGGMCKPNPRSWQHTTWRALRFQAMVPHRYQFRFVNNGKAFVAEARGDLNCDGVTSLYRIVGRANKQDAVELDRLEQERPLE